MVLHQDKKDVITSFGSAIPKKFSIAANAKSFKVLSDSLYKDKIRAIIRELSTNALDSHIAAGKKEEPFYVFLPTQLDPHFEIRDYGIGLSEEDVLNLYSTYFDSDKDQSNDSIGAFGLGSKTPFSYVSSFTVTSWFGGQKKIYTAYIDEDKVPNIVKVHEEESDESNGLSVSFSVKNSDIGLFYERAAIVYRPFDVKPKFNDPNFEPLEYEKIYEGSNFFLSKNRDHYRLFSFKAIYGNIEYPISDYEIEMNEKIRDFSYAVRTSGTLFIHFPLGELDVALSREELSYDEQTKANLRITIESVIDEIIAGINKEIQSKKNFWKARKVYRKYISYRNLITDNFRGQKLNRNFPVDKDKLSVYKPRIQQFSLICSRPDRKKFGYHLNVGDTDYVFFKYDTLSKSKAERRVKGFALNHRDHNDSTEFVLVHDFSIFGKYDTPKCIQVEDLPEESYKQEKDKSSTPKKKETKIMISRNKWFGDHGLVYSSLEELEKDKDKLVLFPVYNGDTYIDSNLSKEISFSESIIDGLYKIEAFTGYKFFFVHFSELKKKRFQPYLERIVNQKPYEELFEAIKDNDEFIQYVQFQLDHKNSSFNLSYDHREVVSKLYMFKDQLINGNKEIIENFWKFIVSKKTVDYNRSIEHVYSLFYRIDRDRMEELKKEYASKSIKTESVVKQIYDFIEKEYSLLGMLRFYKIVEVEEIVEYINAVSEFRKKRTKRSCLELL